MRCKVAALVGTALLAACASRQPSTTHPPAPTEPLPTADDLVQSLARRRAAVRGMSAVARLAYTSPDGSRRTKQVLVAQRPDRLRLEVLSPFGAVFVLTTSDGSLAAYARSERTIYRGVASAENLKRYAQISLPIAFAVDVLLGTPPLYSRRDGVVSRDNGQVKLWQEGERGVRVAWFSTARELVRYEQRDHDGRVLVRATFTGYTGNNGVRFPTRLGLELPPSHQRFDIALRDPEVNPVLTDAVFALETPAGSTEVDLDRVAP